MGFKKSDGLYNSLLCVGLLTGQIIDPCGVVYFIIIEVNSNLHFFFFKFSLLKLLLC